MVHADLPYKQASCARQQRDFCSFAMSLLDMNIHISAWETPCLQICVQKETCEFSNLPFHSSRVAEIVHHHLFSNLMQLMPHKPCHKVTNKYQTAEYKENRAM